MASTNGSAPTREQKMIQKLAQQLASANLRVLDLEIALEELGARAASAEERIADLLATTEADTPATAN